MSHAASVPVLILLLAGSAHAGPLTLLSKADPARPSDTAGGVSEVAGVSADGRYTVFLTGAANLLPGVTDTNRGNDIYLHDRVSGTAVLVSHAAGDPLAAGDGYSETAVISDDGRWVAFLSRSTDLVAGQADSPMTSDLFLYDRVTGANTLVSHAAGSAATATGHFTAEPDISADGRRISYISGAMDLAAGQVDEPGSVDVFLYDRDTGANTLVSHAYGAPLTASGWVFDAVLSADGGWIAFGSEALDMLGPGEGTERYFDIFLYSRATGGIVMASHDAGSPLLHGNDGSYDQQISADGRWVAYQSYATNLVAGQTEPDYSYDVFLYDRDTGTNTLVSHAAASATTAADQPSLGFSLSEDGRWIAFSSPATDIVPGDPGTDSDVFLFDRLAGTNIRVSRSAVSPGAPGTPGNAESRDPQVSADGSFVAFRSRATDLVAGQTDTPGSRDLFVWTRATESMALVTHADGSPATAALGTSALYPADDFRISAGGGWIALTSTAVDLVAGVDDANSAEDVFLYERAAGENGLVSSRAGTASASAGGLLRTSGAVSNDGRWTVFTSAAPNLVPGQIDANNANDVFLHDRVTGAVTLVSRSQSSPVETAGAESYAPLISQDGTAILFLRLTGLFLYDRPSGETVPVGDGIWKEGNYAVSKGGRWVAFASGTDAGPDVFLWDRATGATTLVSHASASPDQPADAGSWEPSLSADGRYLAFRSNASDLVPGQSGAGGLFLYDRLAGGGGATTRFSASGVSPRISADGRRVAFLSHRTDVVPGQVDGNLGQDVFLWDRASGTTVLASRTPGSATTTGNDSSGLGAPPAISANGRFAAFTSYATDLVAGQADTVNSTDVFLFDHDAPGGGTVTLVSRAAGSAAAAGNYLSGSSSLSADGRFVAFTSLATDLVPGQADPDYDEDVFLYDRIAGATSLATHTPGSEVTAAGSIFLLGSLGLSADGAWLAFESPAPDLVPGDLDGLEDVFLHANPLQGQDFFTVSPCRVLDTRLQGPALASGAERIFPVAESCGIPATARSVAVNVTVLQATGTGRVTLYPGDLAAPLASTVNFASGSVRAGNAVLSLALDGTGTLAATPFVAGGGSVRLILDVFGWFQ